MASAVPEAHEELIHYTTGTGLHGVLTTQSFWATHAGFLNDSTDSRHFFEFRLLDVIERAVRPWLLRHREGNKSLAAQIETAGGLEAATKSESAAIATSLRSATENFNEPYIFSMSAPNGSYVRRNGLLSQWRGYGQDGGYGIVLDAKRFEELLYREAKAHPYRVVQWGDVFYSGNHQPQLAIEDVARAESQLASSVTAFLDGSWPKSAPEAYHAITTLSCFYKHGGFAEESEVRLLAILDSEDQGSELLDRMPKGRKFRLRSGLLVPYVELFRELNAGGAPGALPIRRLIIGPHSESNLRKRSAELLLKECGYDVEVTISEIPFIGR